MANNIPNVLVFSVNGNIPRETVRTILKEMESNGHFAHMCLLGRKGEALDSALNEFKSGAVNYKSMDVAAVFERTNQNGDVEPNLVTWDPNTINTNATFKEQAKTGSLAVIAGGAPRKKQKDGSFPDRIDLVDENAPMVIQMVTALVESGFDLRTSKILVSANPLEEMTELAEKTARDVWEKMHGNTDDLPEFVAVGMGGTLDEARYRVHLTDEINAALRRNNVEGVRLISSQVEAHVLGAHTGADMYPNSKSIKIILPNGEKIPLGDFLDQHKIGTELDTILSKSEAKTRPEGENIGKALDRTTFFPPGERNGELAAALLWGEPHEVTASVRHTLKGVTATQGARVVLSSQGAHVSPEWLEAASQDDAIIASIGKNKVTKNLADSSERASLLPQMNELLQGAEIETRSIAEREKVLLRGETKPDGEGDIRVGTITMTGKNSTTIDAVRESITKLLRLTPNAKLPNGGIATIDTDNDSIIFPIANDIRMEKVTAIAKTAGITVKNASWAVGVKPADIQVGD